MLTFSLFTLLDRDVSEKMYGYLSKTILDGSDKVRSSWALKQADNWKHLIWDKYIIVFSVIYHLRLRVAFVFNIDQSYSLSLRITKFSEQTL